MDLVTIKRVHQWSRVVQAAVGLVNDTSRDDAIGMRYGRRVYKETVE